MTIKTHLPKNKTLQKHIAYYYFLQTEKTNFHTSYYAFPHIYTPVSIFRHSSCSIEQNRLSISHETKTEYLTVLIGMFTSPLLVDIQGPVNEITIVFKPLGLNNFITQPFHELAGADAQVFSGWEKLSYSLFLEELYAIDAMEDKVDCLERFLLSRYVALKEQELLDKALALLTDYQKDYYLDEVASHLCLSSKTFSRLFNKHLGVSPLGFKKIARFRYSLDLEKEKTGAQYLTQIALESNFYDQSYFIKTYHQLTAKSPSAFFDSIEKVADDKFILQPVR